MNKQKINDLVINKIGQIFSTSFPKRQGGTAFITFFETEQGQYVWKVATVLPYRYWLKSEAEILKLLNKETNLPVPKYVHFNDQHEETQLLMTRLEGVPLREALQLAKSVEEKQTLFNSFGALLNQLHSTNLSVGMLNDGNWLELQLENATYNLQKYEVDGNEELLNYIKFNKPSPIPQVLIHGDCTIDNVLVRDGRAYAFIDLSGVAFGDPRYDLALATRSIQTNEILLDAFYKGYKTTPLSTEEQKYFDEGLYEFF